MYDDDLVPRNTDDEQKAKLSPDDHQAWRQRAREEALRNRVWSAVFADYTQKRKIEPTPAEIESQVRAQKRFLAEDKVRREKQREELAAELKAPGLSESRRAQAQQHLDTLNSLREHDARMQKERSDPAAEKMWQESEQKVAAMWVKQWKVNQALYREYGGRSSSSRRGGSRSTHTVCSWTSTRRKSAKAGHDAAFAGLLNYACTRLALKVVHLKFGRLRYWLIALLTGTFKNVADELYRRLGAPYEDGQRAKSGDVDVLAELLAVMETTSSKRLGP